MGVDLYQQALLLLGTGAASVFAADASRPHGWHKNIPSTILLTTLLDPSGVVMPKGLQYDCGAAG